MPDSEIIVVDNASTDNSVEMVKTHFSEIILVESPENLGFAKANNFGSEKAQGDFLVFLNPDVILTEASFEKMLRFLESHPAVGLIGPRLIYENGDFQISTGLFPKILSEFKMSRLARKVKKRTFREKLASQFETFKEVNWVTGACIMLRRSLFEQVNGFDDKLFMFFEDADLCKRVHEEGLRVVYFPETEIIHQRGLTYGRRPQRIAKQYRQSQRYYYRKHNGFFSNLGLLIYLKLLKIKRFLKQ
jgi:GT2 family glycosyltransferase